MISLLISACLARIVAFDPMDAIVSSELKPDVVATGFKLVEGPAWSPDGHLVWSDIVGDTIYELIDKKPSVIVQPSFHAIGNTFDPQGRLVTCHQESRSVTRTNKNGMVTTLADSYDGKKLNAPDDVIVRSDGVVYFTDPSFGLSAAKKELGFDGLYKIGVDGKVELQSKDFAKPNGLCLSPDEKLLYVNDTVRRQIHVYDVGATGDLTNPRLFAYITGEMPGVPNGMKTDSQGNVYTTGPGGVQVFTKVGKYLGEIHFEETAGNFCFGGLDAMTLYVTGVHTVYKIRVKIPGNRYAPLGATGQER